MNAHSTRQPTGQGFTVFHGEISHSIIGIAATVPRHGSEMPVSTGLSVFETRRGETRHAIVEAATRLAARLR